ncbi:phage tail protein [Acidovorax sp. BL-A-41-H1]|uniref:phage tail protein n=1 Tax=Acidovorax sp. BL-A-41-H1 TaxID=3421102 RepID=UPI003F78C942
MDRFIGEIRPFGFGRVPQGWAACDGRLLAIAQNPLLFELLGWRYGGDGLSQFALPDLRGRTPIGCGSATNGMAVKLGSHAGDEAVALTSAQVPGHSHALMGATAAASTSVPAGAALAQPAKAAYAAPNGAYMSSQAVAVSGAGLPHSNMQPSLAVNWCIAIDGLRPPR